MVCSEIRDGTLKESNETMIDQTRFWRNQQRSKFKDAIDYLDQIFEDLKKECDPPVCNYSDMNRYSNPLFDTHSQQQSNSHPISQSEVAPRDKTAKVKSVKNPERSKVVSLSEKYNNGDVDVSETIVLPVARKKLKGDRLDFTQKWLEGDLKSWVAAAPKASFDGGYNGEDSFDERSLGSCSAEVAAINSVAKKKKRNRDNANNDKVVEPLKPNRCPQVVRPQPVYGFPTGSNFVPVNASFGDGSNTTANSNFNSFPQPYWDHEMRIADMEHSDHSDYALKRVSSHNQVFDRRSKDMSRRANQDSYNSLGSVKSEDLAFGRPNGAFVQYSPNFSGKKSSAYLNHGSSSAVRMRMNSEQDPILTIDALVAELELNTDQDALNMKRRSFPTKFEPSFSGDVKQPKSKRQLSNVTSKTDVASKGRRKPKGSSFDEMATMLHNVANEVSSLENRSRKAPMSNYGGSVLSPFETINQERLEPSKVEAIQSMFESKGLFSANSSSTQHNPQRLPNPDKCDDTYYELGICNKIAKQPSPSHSKLATKSNSPSNASVRSQKIHKNSLSSHREFTPILSSTSQVPVCQTGSANSSQTGGYFSSGSSLGTSSFHTSQRQPSVPRKLGRQPSLVGAQSLSSQAVSVEDEDDGFYDNIQSDDKKIDCVEADEVSTTSRLPPTAKGTARITQFLKKIGGSKPPGSASSLMSLNKMLLDKTAANLGSITKSSSFSNEPWKEQVIGNNANVKNVSKKTRLGQILKNSLFGSKKKLNDT
uniref:INCENP_ARK-bind domain-containing protein n=1 Tax=Syphacia muris TaxID=451379 RepID=A0A0N5ASA1_9BILA